MGQDLSAIDLQNLPPETATKRTKVTKKRGRKGNKIVTALNAIPEIPVDFDDFVAQHKVSVNVMKQPTRWIHKMDAKDAERIGKVHIQKDKTTGKTMIWRSKSVTA